jgi:D-alanyl-lipoteichoic acid acyltransferase DltB (MBOAT superfamily)
MTIQTLGLLLGVLLLWMVAWHLRSVRQRQLLLLTGSYLFYSAWGVGFLLVLIASSLMNYTWGSILRRRLSAGLLWIGIALNLLLLSFYKYLPPLLEAVPVDSWKSDLFSEILMPIGISFWTFQGLSYLIDIYREEELDPSLIEFCLYMAFWPTVFAGPVCRLPRMLPQFRQVSKFAWDDICLGMRRIVQGLFMKMVLAQFLASGLKPGGGVAAGFDQIKAGWGGLDVWLLAIGFGFQLFFDFAGYSHMVIGVARIFGIRVEENFDRPYLSTTPSAFWTRWHMSLSFWIRDYLFLPFAAMRRHWWWLYLALVLSMALFGLWHAARVTFVVWGIYHGLLLAAHRLGQQIKRRVPFNWPAYVGRTLAWFGTFALVSLGWIFFRANSLEQALTMLRSVLSPSHYKQVVLPADFYILVTVVIIGYFIYHALGILLSPWRALDKEELRSSIQSMIRVMTTKSLARTTVIIVGLIELFRDRMWYWLTPMMLLLSLVSSLIVFLQNSAVAPFIYTQF